MKLTIFQSEKGDCVLLQAASGERMLCDGGMAGSMRDYVRDELTKLRKNGASQAVQGPTHVAFQRGSRRRTADLTG